MSKFKRVLKIILGILVISVFLVGIPIVINECYKANCGYSTAWDASAMLGYYGTILGAIITVVTLVATITFTKKQIQRENFLKNESEKWSKLKSIFLDILSNIRKDFSPFGLETFLIGVNKVFVICRTHCSQISTKRPSRSMTKNASTRGFTLYEKRTSRSTFVTIIQWFYGGVFHPKSPKLLTQWRLEISD